MMPDIKKDIEAIQVFRDNLDDLKVRQYVAFHTQSAIALTLKALCRHEGIDFPEAHTVTELIIRLGKNKVPLSHDEYSKFTVLSYVLHTWKLHAKYDPSYIVNADMLRLAIRILDSLVKNAGSKLYARAA